jgi:hypothetical protein
MSCRGNYWTTHAQRRGAREGAVMRRPSTPNDRGPSVACSTSRLVTTVSAHSCDRAAVHLALAPSKRRKPAIAPDRCSRRRCSPAAASGPCIDTKPDQFPSNPAPRRARPPSAPTETWPSRPPNRRCFRSRLQLHRIVVIAQLAGERTQDAPGLQGVHRRQPRRIFRDDTKAACGNHRIRGKSELEPVRQFPSPDVYRARAEFWISTNS